MVNQKKKQNKKQHMKHFKTYNIRVNAKKELGLNVKKERKITIPIFIPHVGCKNECVFCNQRRISGTIDPVKVSDVKKQIDTAIENYKRDNRKLEVAFFGGSFTGIDKNEQIAYLKIVNYYIKSGVIDSIRLSTRPDYIDQEILDILKAYNVKIIELGVQSMDDKVLALSKRGHTAEDVRRASKLIRENGFVLGHQIMVGLPGSSYEKEEYSINESLALKPDIMRIYPVYILEDSELYEMYKRGIYKPLNLEKALERTTMMYKKCIKSGTNVIRVGLQTTEQISQKNSKIVGPVCDNYREMVLSRIMLEIIEKKLDKINIDKKIEKNKNKGIVTVINICVPTNQVNYAIGNNKCNQRYLGEKDVCYVKVTQKGK